MSSYLASWKSNFSPNFASCFFPKSFAEFFIFPIPNRSSKRSVIVLPIFALASVVFPVLLTVDEICTFPFSATMSPAKLKSASARVTATETSATTAPNSCSATFSIEMLFVLFAKPIKSPSVVVIFTCSAISTTEVDSTTTTPTPIDGSFTKGPGAELTVSSKAVSLSATERTRISPPPVIDNGVWFAPCSPSPMVEVTSVACTPIMNAMNEVYFSTADVALVLISTSLTAVKADPLPTEMVASTSSTPIPQKGT